MNLKGRRLDDNNVALLHNINNLTSTISTVVVASLTGNWNPY
jgi:hypothetical protein